MENSNSKLMRGKRKAILLNKRSGLQLNSKDWEQQSTNHMQIVEHANQVNRANPQPTLPNLGGNLLQSKFARDRRKAIMIQKKGTCISNIRHDSTNNMENSLAEKGSIPLEDISNMLTSNSTAGSPIVTTNTDGKENIGHDLNHSTHCRSYGTPPTNNSQALQRAKGASCFNKVDKEQAILNNKPTAHNYMTANKSQTPTSCDSTSLYTSASTISPSDNTTSYIGNGNETCIPDNVGLTYEGFSNITANQREARQRRREVLRNKRDRVLGLTPEKTISETSRIRKRTINVDPTMDNMSTHHQSNPPIENERVAIASNTYNVSQTRTAGRYSKTMNKRRSVILSLAWDDQNIGSETTVTTNGNDNQGDILESLQVDSDTLVSDYISNDDTSEDSELDDDYDDVGDPSYICQCCNAMMWYDERINKSRNTSRPQFTMCCMNGKVQLPNLKEAPDLLQHLLFGSDKTSTNFQHNIRSYNMMFAFTSMGGRIQSQINNGGGPYTFLLHGQNYHQIGSLLPVEGSVPKFSQLYIFDTENEVQNRIRAVRSKNNSNNIHTETVSLLKDMIDEYNLLAQTYRAARDRFVAEGIEGVKLKLIKSRTTDGRTYNLPSAREIAALVVGDFDTQEGVRDIVVETQSRSLQRISELHPLYLPLQYPILFPYGEDGYRDDILLRDVSHSSSASRKTLSMKEYFAYRIQMRKCESTVILNSRKLFQQFLVDGYSMIESSRLGFIRRNQNQLRVDMYKGIQDRILRGDNDATSIGKRIILPSSFTGGPRYMFNNFVDALQICNWIGFPSLFITMTCNPKWPEIQRFLRQTNLKPEDRPDITTRVFKMKFDRMIKDFKTGSIFGRLRAYVCTIEFQKRGLPHAHILLWLHNEDKPKCSDDIDKVICAEIPDKRTDKKMYKLVKKHMIHGPCGEAYLRSPCMVNGICSKRFPKHFNEKTMADDEGYPLYRRRKDGKTVIKKNVILDNTFVIPYNRKLLLKYRAHINVEFCNQNKSIKYLFKYVNKGHDRVTAAFYQSQSGDDRPQVRDEIKMYYDCRYLSACEATWRTLGYDIHYRDPPVMRLSFHLPDNQQVVFKDTEELQNVINKPSARNTMFLAWFMANKQYPEAKNVRYIEFPQQFVYKENLHKWEPRKQGFSIGRIMHVPPAKSEEYYLRLLLNVQRGCTSYEDVRTVDNIVHPTFKDACYALGLIDDDKEYIDAIKEANEWASGSYVRSLFVILLLSNCLSMPEHVWENCWQQLSDDIEHRHRRQHNNSRLCLSENMLKNCALIEIERLLESNGKSLRQFPPMPIPVGTSTTKETNRLVLDELAYDRFQMAEDLKNYMLTITPEQQKVYDKIMDAVSSNKGGFFFLYGHGGTGKTFIWRTLSAAVRSTGDIVINVASSGIAALLLPGGRTAHSRFSIPINLNENSTCNIKQQSPQAELLLRAKLIIWDEAPMMHRYCFEALDRTLRDIVKVNKPFGGKVVVLGGDFRQILPVIPKASRQDIVHATINSSPLWTYCQVLTLTKNMRLQACSSINSEEIKQFSEWILNIGNGNAGHPNDGEATIQIPNDMLVEDADDRFSTLLQFVYPDVVQNISDPCFFQERALLAPTNESVEYINDYFMRLIPGEEKVYLSSDRMCREETDSEINAEIYTSEFLNNITCSGVPNHALKLKIGAPVMLIRNIDQSRGLCNGTRLQISRFGKHVLNCKILSGKHAGDMVFIPRMTLVPSNTSLPIKFQRRQFPIIISFAMTINKSQGQTLSHVGLYLPKPVFSHGQLYVALSRVKSRSGIKIYINSDDNSLENITKNVVYKEVFQRI